MKTVDGFHMKSSINFLPDKLNINKWSKGKNIKIEVADFYMNPREVVWKGEVIWVGDYPFFVMMVKDWMERYKQTKEQVLDEIFEMAHYGESPPKKAKGK